MARKHTKTIQHRMWLGTAKSKCDAPTCLEMGETQIQRPLTPRENVDTQRDSHLGRQIDSALQR